MSKQLAEGETYIFMHRPVNLADNKQWQINNVDARPRAHSQRPYHT